MSKASIYFTLPDMSDNHDLKDIKKELDSLRGIISISVNAKAKKVTVDFDNTGTDGEAITNRIRELGYSPQLLDIQEHIM
jgi:copper chaperone CopZ